MRVRADKAKRQKSELAHKKRASDLGSINIRFTLRKEKVMHLQIKLDAVEVGGLGNVELGPDCPGKLAILGVARKHFRNRMGKGYGGYRDHAFVTFVLSHEFHSSLYRVLSNLNDGSLLFADKPLLTEIFLPPDGRREEMVSTVAEPFIGRECLFIFEREVAGSLLNPRRYLYAVAKKLTKELREVAQIIRDSEREAAAIADQDRSPINQFSTDNWQSDRMHLAETAGGDDEDQSDEEE